MTLKRLERLRSQEIQTIDENLAALARLKRKFQKELLKLKSLQRGEESFNEDVGVSLHHVMTFVVQLDQIRIDEEKKIARLTDDLALKQKQKDSIRDLYERELASKNKALADIASIEAHKQQILLTKWYSRRKIKCYLDRILLPNSSEELDVLSNKKSLSVKRHNLKSEQQLNEMSATEIEIAKCTNELQKYEITEDWRRQVVACKSELILFEKELSEFDIERQVPLVPAIDEFQKLWRQQKNWITEGLFDEELVDTDDKRLEMLRKTKEKNRKLKEAQEIQISKQQKAVIQRQISQKRQATKYIETHKSLEKEYSAAESEFRKSTNKFEMLMKKRSRLVTRFGDVYPLNGHPEVFLASPNRYKVLKPWPRLITILRSIDVVDEDLSEAREAVQRDEKDLKRLEVQVDKLRNYQNIASKELKIEDRIGLGNNSKRPKVVVTEWRHAEELARDFMRWLGYVDAELTNEGADGGVDVRSRGAIGQVKMHSNGVRRSDIQALVGEAAVQKRTPLFFAMNYSKEAITWSNENSIAIFKFSRSGDVVAVSDSALRLEARSRK